MEATHPHEQHLERVGRLVTLQPLPGGKETVEEEAALLDQLEYGRPVRRHVAEFGALLALVFLVIAGYQAYRYGRLDLTVGWSGAALVIAALGYAAPRLLYPAWKGWMAFAHALGVVMTTLILFFTWTVMFLPMALLLRVIGKKVMEMGFRSPATPSYWEQKKPGANDYKLLERQF